MTAPDQLVGVRRGFTARELLSLYEPSEYEAFIDEWAKEAANENYAIVHLNAGSGDKGRDVIGYLTSEIATSDFDTYQCKHYRHPLHPRDVWIELGKLCYYTHRGEHRTPRYYYLVAPQGVGQDLHNLLENPEALRSRLIASWKAHCETKITQRQIVPLTGDLLDYVKNFDFTIVRALDPDVILAQHQKTRWHAVRFGRAHLIRPEPSLPPSVVESKEARYVAQLLNAYSDDLRIRILDPSALGDHTRFATDLARQRIRYYRAASLHKFEQDSYPDDKAFKALVDEIHRGVIDVCEDNYSSGFARLRATILAARALQITRYPLAEFLDTDDKAGICHHLANDDRLVWCVPDRL